MTRARRVHQGERTHSERRIDPDRHADPIVEGELGPGATAVLGDRVPAPQPDRMCKTCQKHEFDGPLTVAPTGTTHVVGDDPHLTVCGREIGDDWS